MQIARILDHFGFDYIEGGWPNPSNPTDEEFFQKIKEVKLKHAKIAAFGSTRRPKVLPEKDPLLQALVKSGAPRHSPANRYSGCCDAFYVQRYV